MNSAFGLVLCMVAGGQLCARTHVFPDNAADVLNRFVIYVALPALVLTLVPSLRWDASLALLVVVPWLSLVVGALLVHAMAKTLSWPREVRAALLLCVPLGNTSFLGFPMISALVGPDAVRYAVVYDQLGSFLILSTYGLFVLALSSGASTPSLRSTVTRLFTFPPFIALLVALLPLPQSPLTAAVLKRVGETLVPLAMFAVGMKLELRPSAIERPSALAFGLVTKLLVLPALTYFGLRALGIRGVPAQVAVLESGMPPMITAGALAGMAGLSPGLSAALVGYGVLLALASVPALACFQL